MAYPLHCKNLNINTTRLLAASYLTDGKGWALINASNYNDSILFRQHPVLRFLHVSLQAAPC